MKCLWKKIKTKLGEFFRWVWQECKDWRTLVLLAIVCAVLGLPVWGGYLLGLLTGWSWAYVAATVMWGFWMLPGAPFFALSVSLTLAIKRIFEKHQEKLEQQEKEKQSSEQDQ